MASSKIVIDGHLKELVTPTSILTSSLHNLFLKKL